MPKLIIRKDDGEKFILNKNGTYSLEMMIPYRDKGHLISENSLKAFPDKYFTKIYE